MDFINYVLESFGHHTEKAFLTYIKISKKEHAEMMRTVLLQNYSPLKMAK